MLILVLSGILGDLQSSPIASIHSFCPVSLDSQLRANPLQPFRAFSLSLSGSIKILNACLWFPIVRAALERLDFVLNSSAICPAVPDGIEAAKTEFFKLSASHYKHFSLEQTRVLKKKVKSICFSCALYKHCESCFGTFLVLLEFHQCKYWA